MGGAEVNKVAKPANLVGRKFVVAEVSQKIFRENNCHNIDVDISKLFQLYKG